MSRQCGLHGPVKILIVDDDPTYRRILSHTFAAIDCAKVVATAADLASAKKILDSEDIDLLTLDVVLREESGLDLLDWLRKQHPSVVVALLTGGTEKRASQPIDAMLLGAMTLVLKPSGPAAPAILKESLERVIGGIVATAIGHAQLPVQPKAVHALPREVITIGASTGGPPVLLQLLKSLPASIQVPILITQHMHQDHLTDLAAMLNAPGGRTVHLAQHDEPLQPSQVYLANGDKHLGLVRRERHLFVQQMVGPEENFCRPAVDPMFRSVASVCGEDSVGVVMTGMGSDGAKGATHLRERGAPVVVQDEASSVVWGMPGAAVALGAASEVVDAAHIATAVARHISGLKRI